MGTTVTVAPMGSRDGYGAPVLGAAVGVPGHVTYRTKAIRTDGEDRVLSTAQVQLPPAGYVVNGVTVPLIGEGSEVTLPDDLLTRHVLLAVGYTDDTGDHSQMLMLT